MKDINQTWSFGGIPLAVEKDSEDYLTPRIAEIGPLDATYNYVHFGGTEAFKRDLTAVLFTGYKHYEAGIGFYDMVGSGYRALVSDQEAEGDYICVEARTERLQDIHRSPPAKIYRINMKLVKESTPVPTAYNVLVATKTDGLYYATGITFDDATHPEWSLLQGDYGLSSFSVDETSPLATQAMVNSGIAYLRRISESTSWTSIYTPAEALADAQAFRPVLASAEVEAVCYNGWVPGRVYALFRAWTGISKSGQYMSVSEDYGDTWTTHELNYYDFANRTGDGGHIVISPIGGTYSQGYVVWASWPFGSANEHAISVDAGDSWTDASLGSGGFVGRPTPFKTVQGSIYTGHGGSYECGTCTGYSIASYADITVDTFTCPNLLPTASELVEADDDSDNLSLAWDTVKYSQDGGINWNTGVIPGDSNVRKIAGLNFNQILAGIHQNATAADNYHILWSTPDHSTYYEKAGSDPQNNADGKSIPYDCGGIARIVVWEA